MTKLLAVTPVPLFLLVADTAVLLAYGTILNLAPLEFGRVVGLYVAILFVVWQAITYFAFGTLPIVCGGALIVAGGAFDDLLEAAIAYDRLRGSACR